MDPEERALRDEVVALASQRHRDAAQRKRLAYLRAKLTRLETSSTMGRKGWKVRHL